MARAATLALCLLAACVRHAPPTRPAPAVGAAAPHEAEYLRSRRLMVPVDGIRPSQVPDTYAARRGERRHNALDILAPRGTPVLAADDGRVIKVRENRAGGLTIYAVDPSERFVYYYAHLDRYRDRLHEGDRIRQGELLGFVGTSGNAPRDIPHLHFQLMRYDDPKRWWDGAPINPLPFLERQGHRARD